MTATMTKTGEKVIFDNRDANGGPARMVLVESINHDQLFLRVTQDGEKVGIVRFVNDDDGMEQAYKQANTMAESAKSFGVVF